MRIWQARTIGSCSILLWAQRIWKGRVTSSQLCLKVGMLSKRCLRDDQSPWWNVPRWTTVSFTETLSFWLEILSVQFSLSVVSDSLQPHGLQHSRLPCPSPIPRAYSNSCPSSRWCHPTISSSVIPFSSCLQSFPTSGSFTMSQFFASDDQSIGTSASASVLPMNIQDLFPLGWTGWISLQSKGLLRVFSNTTVQKR